MAYDAGLFEALALHNTSNSMCSMVHLSCSVAQTHGHMAKLQDDHGMRAGGGKQHPHEMDVRRLQHTFAIVMHACIHA